MAQGPIQIAIDGSVGIVTLDNATLANSLDGVTIEALRSALDQLASQCRAIVLTGSGKVFCAGAKLTSNSTPPGSNHDAGAPLEAHFNPLIVQIADLRVPLLTAVNGAAAGGGMALALSGDIVIASSTARFVPGFVQVGLVPDCGMSRLLVNAIGRARAAEILLLGEPFDAERAHRLGLVNRIASPDALIEVTMTLAQRLADGPTIALELTRRLLWQGGDGSLRDSLRREREAQCTAGRSEDHAEAIAAFLAKRPPRFSGK